MIDYKELQKQSKESAKPKLVDPKDYTEHDKRVMDNMTLFYSRKSRRKKLPPKPDFTKKRIKRKKRK